MRNSHHVSTCSVIQSGNVIQALQCSVILVEGNASGNMKGILEAGRACL